MNVQQMIHDEFDPHRFRNVLGHFPTGVVVITAMDDDEPVAMVVGSFTSVSLDPPLVAFLPSRSSSSYQRLRNSDRFCVNVLSEEQEELCRRLASRDPRKFDGIAWRRSPSGNPILAGAVAWIDCTVSTRHAAGDHDIVIGTVTALDTEEPAGPLLFFQGGYGRFDQGEIVDSSPTDLGVRLQNADVAREHLVRLAEQTHLEAYVQDVVDGDLVILGAASGTAQSVRSHIGQRLPLRAPYGATFAAHDAELAARWAGDADDEHARHAAQRLERVRARGWSIGLVATNHDEHWATISREKMRRGPAGADERIVAALNGLAGAYDPSDDVLREGGLNVRILSAPVLDGDGGVVQTVAVFGFAEELDAAAVIALAARLRETAAAISADLSELSGRGQ